MNKLKAINSVQFSIQLITALLLLYFTLKSDTPDRAIIPILLLLGCRLVFIREELLEEELISSEVLKIKMFYMKVKNE